VTALQPDPTATLGPPAASGRRSPVRRARAYLALTKPRIIELLLVTTVPTMVLAAGGLPSPVTVLATLVGGSLAAGSANALNCYFDRDIDAVMRRTVNRPLVTGEIPPAHAAVFGGLLGVLAVAILGLLVNPLAAWLAVAAIGFYVVGYTLLLKRRTPQNIVWGGAAGCMPVLIGWAAVRGRLDWAALVLFGIVFLWTPPHYWPLSLRFRSDYAAAGVPMLPVVAAPVQVARRVVAYSWAMVACSLLLIPVAGTGWVYGLAAAGLGANFLYQAHALHRRTVTAVGDGGQALTSIAPMRLFHASISYLTLLFVAIGVDPFLRW
jgi:protoheme IX farnesyltransferase